jgi:succinoglycan biosynthesis transport protein ExoP
MNSGNLLKGASELAPQDARWLMNVRQGQDLPGQELGISDYWRILVKRKWTIIVCLVMVTTAALVISWRMTRMYDGIVHLTFSRQVPTFFGESGQHNSVEEVGNDPLSMETQVKILESNSLALLVIHNLDLEKRTEFAGKEAITTSGGLAVSGPSRQQLQREEHLILALHENMKIQQVGNTSIIEIRYSNPDPNLAAEVANGIASAFIEQNIKARFDTTMAAADWLAKQLGDLQIKVETSQAKLVQYQKEHGIVGIDDKQNLTLANLDEVNRELTQAQGDRIQKESLYQMAKQGHADALSAVLQDSVLGSLRQQQDDLHAQYAQLSTQFGPAYPKVVELQNRLQQVNLSYQEQISNGVRKLQNDYQVSLGRERMLQVALDTQKVDANKLSEDAIQFKVLQQEAESNRQLYDGLLRKLKEASLAAGLNSSNIRVVDSARVPLRPARPNVPRNLEFALLLGLVGGIAIAFSLEALDSTVRTPDQAETVSGLPMMAVIPMTAALEHKAMRRSNRFLGHAAHNGNSPPSLVSFHEPQSEIAEAYRALRTSILLSTVGQPPQTIVITSAVPQDGKTMTSINAAIVLAQQGKRVLLVDGDLRRPSIHKAFNLQPEAGLSNILSGGAKWSDAVLSTIQPNLFLIPSGPLPPQPSELLGSALMQDLVEQWRKSYDHIIVDSPPILSVTDAVLLSILGDMVILVVRSGQTMTGAVRRARDLLLNVKARTLGIVLNAADLRSPDYYYYYGSRYRYYDHYYTDKKAPKLKGNGSGNEESTDSDEQREPSNGAT